MLILCLFLICTSDSCLSKPFCGFDVGFGLDGCLCLDKAVLDVKGWLCC
jgi:hypothetical protein